MDRINRITECVEFRAAIERIDELEKDRIYCKHGIEHLLDTARIAYIISLERGLSFNKETIYAAALLHDIGRSSKSAEHEKESVKIAIHKLDICGFSKEEKEVVTEAVERHREKDGREDIETLSDVIREADKLSRVCAYCDAKSGCKWTLLNTEIIY